MTESARLHQLEAVIFAPTKSHQPEAPVPRPGSSSPSKPKTAGGDGFGSLAHAFGAPVSASSPPAAPLPKAMRKPTAAVTFTVSGLAALSSRHLLVLLGSLGREPRRNRDDLMTLIVLEAVDEPPRTRAAWEAARQKARDDPSRPVGPSASNPSTRAELSSSSFMLAIVLKN